jgi:hypothetical protein
MVAKRHLFSALLMTKILRAVLLLRRTLNSISTRALKRVVIGHLTTYHWTPHQSPSAVVGWMPSRNGRPFYMQRA